MRKKTTPGLRTLALLTVGLCAGGLSRAGTWFEHVGIREGLSQSTVTAIVQDPHGFLWIGTQDGLNRYDGYEVRVYRPDPGESGTLTDASITCLDVEPSGTLWVGTAAGGVNRYDPRTDQFTAVDTATSTTGGVARRITAILSTRNGDVWVASHDTVVRGTPVASRAEPPLFQSLLPSGANSLFEDRGGTVWIGTDEGAVYRHDASGLQRVALAGALGANPGRAIRAFADDGSGGVWIGTDSDRLVRLSRQGAAQTLRLRDLGYDAASRIRSLASDADGTLWVGGLEVGLVRLDAARLASTRLRRDTRDPFSLSDSDVLSLLIDDAHELWVGTLVGGVNRLRLRTSGFAHYRHVAGDASSLAHDSVSAFAEAGDGRFWIGTDGGGLDLFDSRSGRFEAQRLAASAVDRVWAVQRDPYGTLWVGTGGAGLWRRPEGSDRFAPVTRGPGRVITAIVCDRDDVWVASADDGLARLTPDGRLAEHFGGGDASSATRLGESNLTSLLLDDRHGLWIGSGSGGLSRFDPASRTFVHYRQDPADPGSLPHDKVRALAPGSHGRLWIGTGVGLASLDVASGRFTRFDARAGLPSDTVYSVVEDRQGVLWVGTNSGLVRFDPATRMVREYGPQDGVQGFEFNGNAFLAAADGRVLFGGVNGFNLFDPAAVERDPVPRTVALTDVLLSNVLLRPKTQDPQSTMTAAAVEIESLTLPPAAGFVTFRFASPLPSTPQQLRYAYRLEGFDADWQWTTAERRFASYSNLAPGRYVLRIRARSADGAFTAMDRIVQLRILPPWWRTWPAYLLLSLLGVMLLIAASQWRTVALRQEAARLQDVVAERTRALISQKQVIEDQARHLEHALATKERLFAQVSHEFRTPLTLILNPIEALLVDERRGRTSAWMHLMRRNAKRLLTLVDQLLGLARLSGEQPLQLAPLAVTPVVRGAVAAFDSVARSKRVELTLGVLDDAWVAATPETLERIVTNLISNAVKYTPAGGHVQVSVQDDGATAWIRVADDGPGVPSDEQARIFEPFHRTGTAGTGTGLGLALVRECAQALGGSVVLDSGPGVGATFSVRLPVCRVPPRPVDPDAEGVTPSERMLLEADNAAQCMNPLDDRGFVASLTGSAAGDERPRVLIVEDNADLRVLLAAALGPAYRCTVAVDGREGIVAALADPPDLVVSDVMMPTTDGFELVHTLKLDPRTSHVPVILLTALGDRASRLQGLQEHADEFLVKPFDMDELLLRVRNLIDARQIVGQRAAHALYAGADRFHRTGAADPSLHGPRERVFLERLRNAAAHGYASGEFGVAELAHSVAMSERQLQRKLRALLGVSPAEYLREFRLQQSAAQLAGGASAGAVAHDCGFSSQSHFGSCFKARFGVTPGEYRLGAGRARAPGASLSVTD